MELNLAYLINPLKIEDFFDNYWGKKAIAISTDSPEKFSSLFGWHKFNYLLNFHRLQYPDDIRFVKDGEILPPQSPHHWLSQLQQGATVTINHIHQLEPSLAQLASTLSYELGHHTQINTYCTPSKNQGFDCHYDTHDVLILQIDGEKEWFVLPETISHPISAKRSNNDLPPDDLPYLKIVLKQGDVLYIPRGHWHYAVSKGDRVSLHLTVGINCDTGLDWLTWLQDKLCDFPSWRENLPLLLNGDTKNFQEKLQILGQELATQLQNPTWIQEYANHILARQRTIAPINLPQQLGHDLFSNGLETRLWRSKTVHYHIEKLINGGLTAKIGGKQLDFEGNDLSLVHWILQQTDFSLLDLAEIAPNVDWNTVIEPLLTQLVMEGIYFIDS